MSFWVSFWVAPERTPLGGLGKVSFWVSFSVPSGHSPGPRSGRKAFHEPRVGESEDGNSGSLPAAPRGRGGRDSREESGAEFPVLTWVNAGPKVGTLHFPWVNARLSTEYSPLNPKGNV